MAPPPILTPAQFKKRNPNGSYKKYLARLSRQAAQRKKNQTRKARQNAKRYDWLKPLTPAQIQQQIQTAISTIVDPQMAALTDRFQQAMGQGMGQISGYASDSAQQLSGIPGQVGGYYQQAQGMQQGADAALYQQAMHGGRDLALDVGQQLGMAGLDQGGALDLAQMTGGAAGAGAVMGSAQLSQLLSQGAAAQSYYGSLPAVARAQGASDARLLQMELGRQHTDALSTLQSQIPQLLFDLTNQLQEREIQKQTTALGFGIDTAKLDAAAAADAAERRWKARQAALDRALRQWQERQANRRNREDNATSRQNTADRIAAQGDDGAGGAKDKLRKRRQEALGEAIALARALYAEKETRVNDYGDEVYSYPYHGPGGQVWKKVFAQLQALLPNAPRQVLVRLANRALTGSGYYTYQAPVPPRPVRPGDLRPPGSPGPG